jgi:hypothetical protein
LAREAVNTCSWPLYEVDDGVYRITYTPEKMLLRKSGLIDICTLRPDQRWIR